MENLRDFANRFTHTHEGENRLRAYQVMFPQQFEEAVRNTVILEEILDDQEPALEALTKVGGIEFLLEETTIRNLQLFDLMKKRSPIYHKIGEKSRQIEDFLKFQSANSYTRNVLTMRGYTLKNPVVVVVLNIAKTELTQAQIVNECRRTLARKAGAAAKNGREATVTHVVGIMPDKNTFWVHIGIGGGFGRGLGREIFNY